MKHSLNVIFLLIVINFCYAQEFAPINAQWYYSVFNINPNIQSYTMIKVVGDTIIQNKICKILYEYTPNEIGTPLSGQLTHYVYYDSSKVFYYKNQTNEFYLLYNFNCNVGESWVLNEFPSEVGNIVVVDSVDYLNINGTLLKVQYIHLNSYIILLGNFIIQNIGSDAFLFPELENTYVGPLRCYTDSIIGFYQTNNAPYCDFTTDVENVYQSSINVFPNPFTDEIKIKLNDSESFRIQIFNNFSVSIMEKEFMDSNVNINLEFLKKGIYFLNIYFNKMVFNYKLIKI